MISVGACGFGFREERVAGSAPFTAAWSMSVFSMFGSTLRLDRVVG